MERKQKDQGAPLARLRWGHKPPVDVRDLRQQIEREYRSLVCELRVRCLEPKSSLAEYRARRAAELTRWNHWSARIEWAIAEDRP